MMGFVENTRTFTRAAVALALAALCAAMSGGCSRDPLSSDLVTHPTITRTPLMTSDGKPVIGPDGKTPLMIETVTQVPVRSRKGAPATQNGLEWVDDDGSLHTTSVRDPVVLDLSKGAQAVIVTSGAMRIVQATRSKDGVVSLLGGGTDDLVIDEITANQDGSFTLKGLRGTASTVEIVIAQQLAILVPGWQELTKAEKEFAIERVKELVAAGRSIAEAAAEVALKAIAPIPTP